MRNALVNALGDVIKNNKNSYLLTGDLGWGVFDDLLKNYPTQCINVGIAEQNMIGIAAGLALEGKKVFCYSIVPFITMRAYEQIRVDICTHNLDVTLIGVGGGFAYGMLGNTHYGLEDINVMRGLPNMKIFCPVDKIEMMMGLKYVLQSNGPFYIRLNRGGEPDIISDSNCFSNIHEGVQLFKSGSDVLILSTGRIGGTALEVSTLLGGEGFGVSHITVPIVKPLNCDYLLQLIISFKAVFVIEEHSIYGGLGTAVAELIAENGLSKVFKRFGINDQFYYIAGDQEYMKKIAGLDTVSLVTSIKNILHV